MRANIQGMNTSKGEQILAKQEENGKDLIKIIIIKPDEQIKQSDIHKFIEELRRKDFEFNTHYIAVKQKYHECYDSEIALRVKVGEAQQQNEVVKNTRAEVADKLHPVIKNPHLIINDRLKQVLIKCL